MSNLVNLERVEKTYGVRPLLAGVSLGVAERERIGVVGRNGSGKTTLLRVLAGVEPPDAGRVARSRSLHTAGRCVAPRRGGRSAGCSRRAVSVGGR